MREKAVHRDSFVVRIWREKGQPGWTGWVQHARTGESIVIRNPEELWAFIERWTGKLSDMTRQGVE